MKLHKLFIILLFGAAACSSRQSASTESSASESENVVRLTDAEMHTAGIEIGLPEKGLTSSVLKVNGLVDVLPQNLVSISFPLGGYLVSTKLIPGMKVHKGQAIAEMQDQSLIQLQQDYLVARSRASFLRKEVERQKLLNVTQTTSDKVLEQTQSEYQTQVILMSSLREKLRMIRIDPATLNENTIRRSVMIYAPISGYVSAVLVNVGKYVNPSDVLFELVNPSDLHLSLKVFEKDLPHIRKGQKVKVKLVNLPERSFDAEVYLVSRNLDADRSALVHCDFRNATDDLLPGMFAQAEIATESKEALTVPEEAVVRWGEEQYIFLQKAKDMFEMAAVTVGVTNNGRTELSPSHANLKNAPLITRNAYAALMKLQNKAE